MIALFRLNDPYRLVLVLLVLIGLRMPYLLDELVPTVLQFRWMLLGETLNSGGFIYKDIYEYTGPFSALIFQLIDLIFGRSLFASSILSLMLVMIQSLIFNNFLLLNKAFTEGTYIPAYCYAVFMSLHFDFLTITPVSMALTFILLALSNIFRRIDNQTKDELFIETGFYLGIATCFYLPSAFLFFVFLIILIVYSNSLIRRLLLMAVGFAMVILISCCYFYFVGGLREYISFYLNSLWNFNTDIYFNSWKTLLFLLFPFLMVFVSLFTIYLKGKFANFQLKFQQAILFLFIGSSLLQIIVLELSYFVWVLMMPSVAFFVAHFILLIKNRIYVEGFNAAMLAFVFLSASYSYEWSQKNESDYFIKEEAPLILSDRKIIVFGDDLSLYQSSKVATPFMNWKISKKVLRETGYYDNLIKVLHAFEDNPPDIVVDLENIMPDLQNKIPVLKKNYLPIPNYPGYYQNINN